MTSEPAPPLIRPLEPDSIEFAPGMPRVDAVAFKVTPIEAFAAVREASAEALVGSKGEKTVALAAGSTLLAYGDGGAGKTTLGIDLAFHLAAGRNWFGLEVPRRCRVLWIENEGPRGSFREKLDEKIGAWDGPDFRGYFDVLEDPWSLVLFTNEDHRGELARVIAERKTDVLVAGPVHRLGVKGGGTPAEVADFVRLIEQTRADLGRPLAVVLIHHENKGGAVSGAWEGVPDTTIHVQAQGNGRTRLLWEKVRWGSKLHRQRWHLLWRDGEGFEIEEKPDVTEDTMADDILAAIAELPGGSWTKIREHVTGNATEAAGVRDSLLDEGVIVNTAPRKGQFKLWRSDDPAAPRSELGTGLERLTFPLPSEAVEPTRSTVPAVEGTGNGNGPARTGIDADELDRLQAIAAEMQAAGELP